MREINYNQGLVTYPLDLYNKIYLYGNLITKEYIDGIFLNEKYAKRKRIIDKLLAENQ